MLGSFTPDPLWDYTVTHGCTSGEGCGFHLAAKTGEAFSGSSSIKLLQAQAWSVLNSKTHVWAAWVQCMWEVTLIFKRLLPLTVGADLT